MRKVLGLIVLLAACKPTTPPAASSQKAQPPPAPGPGEWETWSHDQKKEYMKSAVVARERQLFSEYDAKRFSQLECKTCHGAGAADGSFKMPNPDLPKWPGGKDAFVKLKAEHPKTLHFMQQVVVPETARLLGVKAFDFATHTGFSCFQCHVRGAWNGIEPPAEANH